MPTENTTKIEQASGTPPQHERVEPVEFPRETASPEKRTQPPSELPSARTSQQQYQAAVEEAAHPTDPITREIETILEDGLERTYAGLDEATKQEFRTRGEETASTIRKLLEGAKVRAHRIVRLIADWLRILPGLSRFFVEQEAKIKTDRVLALKRMRDSGHE